jgi:hypothetical protein
VNTVLSTVGVNSSVDSAGLVILNSYLVYNMIAEDSNYVLHRVIVDAGNGKVLSHSIISTTTGLATSGNTTGPATPGGTAIKK